LLILKGITRATKIDGCSLIPRSPGRVQATPSLLPAHCIGRV